MHSRRLSSIPPRDSASESRAKLHELASEIERIQQVGDSSRMAELLTELAVHNVVVADLTAARRATIDALRLTDLVEDALVRGRLAIRLGEVCLEVFEAHAAERCFNTAIAIFDADVRDPRAVDAAARARVGLARALAARSDPSARVVLEDAGTAFEDLGNQEAVRVIDMDLRELAAEIEESPASFQMLPRPKQT